jgi:hypothetical protein
LLLKDSAEASAAEVAAVVGFTAGEEALVAVSVMAATVVALAVEDRVLGRADSAAASIVAGHAPALADSIVAALVDSTVARLAVRGALIAAVPSAKAALAIGTAEILVRPQRAAD